MPDMRFAPPSALRSANTEGLNPSRVRTHNDRLILSLLRQHASLSRMEIGKITGLSPQTVSVIVRALEADQLCVPVATRRGSIGPPTTQMSLNADGAFAIGFHFGLSRARVVLVDFLGNPRFSDTIVYDERIPADLCDWMLESSRKISDQQPFDLRERLVGFGIVVSDEFERISTIDDDKSILSEFEQKLQYDSGLEVYVQNDVTAAASAEVIFGGIDDLEDFVYLFIGRKIGARLVLNHRVYSGAQSTSVAVQSGLIALDNILDSAGKNREHLWDPTLDWPKLTEEHAWKTDVSGHLADIVRMVVRFVNVRDIVIDGDIPRRILDDIVTETIELLVPEASGLGESSMNARPGSIGRFAKAIGAASVPLYARYMDDAVGISGFLER